MACTSTTQPSFEEDNMKSIGDFSIDLGLGGNYGQSGTFDSSRKTTSESISSISYGASNASIFGSSGSSIFHSRWEPSASEGESNVSSNDKTGVAGKRPITPTQSKPALRRIPRGKTIKTVLTRASSITSLFGESLDDSDQEQNRALRLHRRLVAHR